MAGATAEAYPVRRGDPDGGEGSGQGWRKATDRYDLGMGKRISVYLDDQVITALNAHTRLSPLSRSEVIGVALRRFLRDERRKARGAPTPGRAGTEPGLARRIAAGELPSQPVDGLQAASSAAPFGN